jgi:transposase
LLPYARKTARLKNTMEEIGNAVGGNASSFLAKKLGINVSSSTLLRATHDFSIGSYETPRVLGVDDWAFKKGNNYGTILVDLEKKKPIDLLPDRTAETLTNWLKEHPSVEIISRDRSGAYALGATEGAPEAIQVADCWHLLKNLGEAVKRMLDKHNVELRIAAETLATTDVLPIETDKENSKDCTLLTTEQSIKEKDVAEKPQNASLRFARLIF